jgi:flagellar biosynthesis chaperone FliJ
MSTYNINLPAATSFGITNIYNTQLTSSVEPSNNDNNVEPNNVTVNVTNPIEGFSFIQNVLQTLQDLTTVDPNQTVEATDTTITTTSSTTSNPLQALQAFLHDLNQALTQTSSQQITVDSPEVDATDEMTATTTLPSEINAAYSSPATNLQNLINSLGTETEQNTVLQADFTNLVQSLGSNSSVTLQDFLTQLAVKVGNGDVLQNPVGNFFSTTA